MLLSFHCWGEEHVLCDPLWEGKSLRKLTDGVFQTLPLSFPYDLPVYPSYVAIINLSYEQTYTLRSVNPSGESEGRGSLGVPQHSRETEGSSSTYKVLGSVKLNTFIN